MKIVHILPAMIKGGGERVAVNLANEAVKAGHQVALVAGIPADPTLLQNDLAPGVDVRFIAASSASKLGNYLKLLPWLWRNRHWLAQQDIVHCHLTLGAAIGSLIQATRRLGGGRGPAVVETYHAVGMPIPNINRSIHAAMAARRDALALMAEDDYWRDFLAKRPQLIAAIIPNGVAIHRTSIGEAERRAYRHKLGIPEGSLVVGTVGRLEAERQPWLYVPIFAEVARALGPDVHFILGGAGPELENMRALARSHGLEGLVHLPGLVRDSRLAQSAMDLYLTLNVGPDTGIAALEAAAAGVPVLAIQLLPDYPAGETDWIWSSADPSALSARAIMLLGAPDQLKRLAERQSGYVRSHRSAEAMARAYEQLYRAALTKVQGGS